LQIDLSKKYAHPCAPAGTKLKVFLLPRELTPDQQQFDQSVSKELQHFLDTGTHIPVFLDKLLNPKERCVMTFGTLTKRGDPDPFQLALLSKKHEFYFNSHDSIIKHEVSVKDQFSLSLGLDFSPVENADNTNCYIVIPCGKISFPK
jgi:hypothetical protein